MTDMFDWNDQELKDVIWGDTNESDDRIVPYIDGNEAKPPDLFRAQIKEETNQEASNVKSSEQNKHVAKSDFNGAIQERSSQYDPNKRYPTIGFRTGSWPDLCLSSATRTDQDTMFTESSEGLGDVSEYDSSRDGGVAQLDIETEVFPQQQEDREETDFIDYGWADIGSFDDLDRIFSKKDTMFEQLSLCNADEICSSSKTKTSSTQSSFKLSANSPSFSLGAVRSTTEHFEPKAEEEYKLDQDPPLYNGYDSTIALCGGTSNLLLKDKIALDVGVTPPLNPQLDAGAFTDTDEFPEKLFSCVQMNKQKKVDKSRQKLEAQGEGRQFQDLHFTRSPSGKQFDSKYAINMGQSEKLQFSNNFQYPLPVVPRVFQHHGEVPFGYEIPHGKSNPLNKFPAIKPLTMTPEEKIEKLRRRQQMRAMLAIQKQQQQFNHQDSCSEHSISGKYLCSNTQTLGFDENLSSQPSLEVAYCSVEETILRRLQDTIAKMDTEMRLCIRDSLFRLAQSAIKRKYAGNTSSISESHTDVKVQSKGDINNHNRFDMETDTNPIDRAVAQLLFHRPVELLSINKLPVSSDLPLERKSMSLEAYESHHRGLKSPHIFANESETSTCVDTSVNNMTDTETVDPAGTMKIHSLAESTF